MREGLDDSTGLHHIRIPVADLDVSRAFWQAAFGYRHDFDFPGEVDPAGVALRHDGDAPNIVLWHAPALAVATSGFTLLGVGVPTTDAVLRVRDRLDALGIAHDGIHAAFVGVKLTGIRTPDGAYVGIYVKPGVTVAPAARAPQHGA